MSDSVTSSADLAILIKADKADPADKAKQDLLDSISKTVKMMDRGMMGLDIKVVRKTLVLLAAWIALQSTGAGAQQLMCTNWGTDAVGQAVCLNSVPVQPPPVIIQEAPPVVVQDPVSSFFGGLVGGLLFRPGYGWWYGNGWHRDRGGWGGGGGGWGGGHPHGGWGGHQSYGGGGYQHHQDQGGPAPSGGNHGGGGHLR